MTAGHTHPSPGATGLSETRRAILAILKREGTASIREIARELKISYESVRQQVGQMRADGWLEPRGRSSGRLTSAGRPTSHYHLTVAGEHLFPKHYDDLSVELIDAVIERLGNGGLRSILEHLTEVRVREWAPQLAGLTLREKINALKGIYLAEDPFMSVQDDGDGELRLIEHNCPFLNVATRRPALCSLTLSTLTHLLGYRVIREERFQDGHGRCVFRVLTDQPVAQDSFRFEFETEGSDDGS